MSRPRLKNIFINKNRGIILGLVSLILFVNTGVAAAACSPAATGTTTVNSAPASSAASSPTFTCGSTGTLAWIMCPLITLMENAAYWLDEQINLQMTINSCLYFNPVEAQNQNCGGTTPTANSCLTNEGFYTAWSAVRSLALGLLVIGALIMVIAQALGFEAIDAYTVRKVLPRILIAVIGISLSYQLIQFAIQVTNDMGVAIQSLIYGSFSSLGGGISIGQSTAGIGAGILIGAAAFLVVGGMLATLAFVGTALVAAFAAFFVIVLRQILIIFLAILAPIAIAMYILPGTEKLWKMWRNTFVKALVMFPLIAGIIATGHVFAEVAAGSNGGGAGTIDSVIALIAYFGPYFIIPSTFKFAGGILAGAGAAASKVNKSVNKSLSGYRKARRKTVHEKRMEGTTRFGSGATGNFYRRVATGSFKKSKFEAVNQRLMDESANKRLKSDEGRTAGDDNATSLARQDGMTGDKFIKRYSEKFAEDEFVAGRRTSADVTDQDKTRATVALKSIETNFGARIGSSAIQVAAFKASAASVNAYEPGNIGDDNMYKDAGRMVRSGLISESSAVTAIRSNKARQDHAASFGSVTAAVQESAANGGASLGNAKLEELRNEAYQGAKPAEIVEAHQNTIKGFAPVMVSNVQKYVTAAETAERDVAAAITSGDIVARDKAIAVRDNSIASRDRELAKIAGLYDTMAQTAPKKAEIFAKSIMSDDAESTTGQKGIIVNGQKTSVQKLLETVRTSNSDSFTQMRREMMMQPPATPAAPTVTTTPTTPAAPPSATPTTTTTPTTPAAPPKSPRWSEDIGVGIDNAGRPRYTNPGAEGEPDRLGPFMSYENADNAESHADQIRDNLPPPPDDGNSPPKT